MGKQANGTLVAYLPLVFAATFAVVLAPMLFVLWLRESGAVASMWVALAIGVVMSLAASQVGAAIWKSKANSDLLFNELMLWGWVQRWRSERRLAAAANLLGLSVGRPDAITGGQLSSEEKKRLLTQLTSSLEASDPYTHGHSRRVARHAANIAKQMGLSGGEIAKIRAAGAMHDVGKVETPTAVLHKAGRLTDEEFDIVKRHPVDGADMVATLDDDELTAIVRHHHERLDGTGYPDGLAGDEIPLGARILAVADTFDAITSTRPYRQANPHKKALDILEHRGRHPARPRRGQGLPRVLLGHEAGRLLGGSDQRPAAGERLVRPVLLPGHRNQRPRHHRGCGSCRRGGRRARAPTPFPRPPSRWPLPRLR